MRLKFDANQPFQRDALEAVLDLFEGQPFVGSEVSTGDGGFPVVPNRLELPQGILLRNLQGVQVRNLPERLQSEGLEIIEGTATGSDGQQEVRFPNFSVEMETGTGKTYVYLRTALELSRRYGMRKFVVVVPSIAICEGVLKTLAVTRDHFAQVFGNLPYAFHRYTSDDLNQVRNFAVSSSVEFMVMTLASFNKASNLLLQSTDRLQGETPVHLLQATRPILILDEPQNMESPNAKAALCTLNPLFALRYSATHRNPYNLVYRLTPAAAYEQGLVKKIEVSSVTEQGAGDRPYIYCDKVTSAKNTLRARLRVQKLSQTGNVSETTITAKVGEDLQQVTNRPGYAGYEIEEIDYGAATVTFRNGVTVREGETLGGDKEPIFRAQIAETLRRHFDKQRKLTPSGIKVLSLFFIDRVANYAAPDGLLRRLFDECFRELAPHYDEWRDRNPEDLRAAYFAQQKRRDGHVDIVDSTTGEAQRDAEAYELIMRRKEALLSFDEPVSFIFSHSALREGWDNPNVFQICTLNDSVSEMRKRQEIGRGIRLAVDQQGARVFDDQVNVLTVVANQSYDDYVRSLQSELTDEGFASEEQGPPPPPARSQVVATLREDQLESAAFVALWERISRKTRYAVEVDTAELVKDVVNDLSSVQVPEPRIVVRRVAVEVTDEGADTGAFRGEALGDRLAPTEAPDLLGMLRHHLEHTHPKCTLTRGTLLQIVQRPEVLPKALLNPQAFVTEAARIIRHRLAEQIVSGIKYTETGEFYEQSKVFARSLDCYLREVVTSRRGLYTYTCCDSEVERDFAKFIDDREDVLFYTKLPTSFSVDTPVGRYSPDWALVAEREEHDGRRQRLYLIRETKGTTDRAALRPDERHKVACGEKHFEVLNVDFRIVSGAQELLP